MYKINLKNSNNQDLLCEIEKPELIYGATAVILPQQIKERIFHPLTNEELPTLVISNTKTPYLLTPAHNQSHFGIAKKHNLPIKQVIAPLYQGTGTQTIRPELPIQLRKSVIAVVKHWNEDSYLCVDSLHRNCKSFVLGGRENNETPE